MRRPVPQWVSQGPVLAAVSLLCPVRSQRSLHIWCSVLHAARRLASRGQCWNWLAWYPFTSLGEMATVCLFVGCLTSQQHASVSQGRICSDNFTCCHTEIEAADPTFHLTQSQYTDTGSTSPSADSITPGAWQGRMATDGSTYDLHGR